MNTRGFSSVVIILIVAVLLVAGGFWYYGTRAMHNGTPQVATSVSTSTADATPTAVATTTNSATAVCDHQIINNDFESSVVSTTYNANLRDSLELSANDSFAEADGQVYYPKTIPPYAYSAMPPYTFLYEATTSAVLSGIAKPRLLMTLPPVSNLEIPSLVVIGDDLVYQIDWNQLSPNGILASTASTSMEAIDVNDGKLLWQTSPEAFNGSIQFIADDGSLYGLDGDSVKR